ncbi:MAG: response regulator, partial [Henriciella sp.]
ACRDGALALALAIERRPELVIMDIQLNGMSGLELTQRLKADERTRRIPVLAVTAFAMRNDEKRIRAAGCDGYLPKPIQVDSFFNAVAAIALERALA